ncbi:MAG: hypothetical protein WA885_17540 [Phormidesmis sp.]
MNDPALLELFTRLRKSDIPLGVAEYHLLLQAMDAGFGTGDREALAQLCRTLWIKSPREEEIFQTYFDQLIPAKTEPALTKSEINKDRFAIDEGRSPFLKEPKKTSRATRFLALAGLVTIIVAAGSFFLLGPEQKNFLSLRGSQSSAGRLAFGGFPFLPIIVKENEGKVGVKIVRTGGSQGEISATLIIDDHRFEQGTMSELFGDLLKPGTMGDTTRSIDFADGQVKDIVDISLVNDKDHTPDRTILLRLEDSKGGTNIGNRSSRPLIIREDDPKESETIPFGEIAELGFSAAALAILIPILIKMRKNRQIKTFEDETTASRTSPDLSKTTLSTEVLQTMMDDAEAARVSRGTNSKIDERFPLRINSLPLTHRQMKQGWRSLRQFNREGPARELDVEATIRQVCQQGVLLSPVLVSPRINRIELLLLIDRDGSMVPFHHLAEALADTAFRGGRFSRVRLYYFHNCPDEYLHRDPYHLEAEPMDECLSSLPKGRTVCLIFSDAGAARGGSSSKRRRRTKFFLRELGSHVRYITWLNPVPRQRWETTTAQSIAELVPMFEVNRQDFYSAMDVLRGRYRTNGKAFR